MRFAAPDGGRRFRPGRMYLQNRPILGTLETAKDQVQFALVPYPTTVRYGIPQDGFQSKADENRSLNIGVANWLAAAKAKLDPKMPSVLMAHLHVAGAGMSHTLFQLTEADDVVFDTGPLVGPWQYIALGHVHKAQAMPGLPHVRYAGSLDRLHMDEREYDTGVVLFELNAEGLKGEPQVLPLAPTPMHQITIVDPSAELAGLAERIPNPEAALVHVTVSYVPGGPSRDQISRVIRDTFPRYTDIVWAKAEPADGAVAHRIALGADYRDTVRKYLERELADDRDRAALLALAESFLTPEKSS
jgi:exonuclease SbcD